MTLAKASSLAMGFVGAMALGVWVGPHITGRLNADTDTPTVHASESAGEAAVTRKSSTPGSASRRSANRASSVIVAPSAPELHARLKPLLNRGADMTIASDGFRDSEQFAAIAHAARNTEVPFVLLKHRVLKEGKSLTAAIRESKPDINAAIEADRARAEARSTLAAIGS